MHFRMDFSISAKIVAILIGITLNLYISFGSVKHLKEGNFLMMDKFYILIVMIHE